MSNSSRSWSSQQNRSMRKTLDGPSWRWNLASAMHNAPAPWMRFAADDEVIEAVKFLETCDEDGVDNIPDRFKATAAAEAFWNQDALRSHFILLELGACTVDVISEQLAVDVQVAKIIRRLFFDVGDHRTAVGWINAHVMAPERNAGNFQQAARYGAAFSGGPAAAIEILRSEAVVPEDEASRLQSLEQALHVKASAALEMPLNDANDSAKITRAVFDYEHHKQRLKLEREKSRRRSEREIREHKLAERRIQLAEEKLRVQIEFTHRQKAVRHGSADRTQIAKLQRSLQQERHQRAQLEATARAAASPLAALSWSNPLKQPLTCDLGQLSQIRERQDETVTFTAIGIETELDQTPESLTVGV
jgi:hypothetical protein